VPVSLLSAKRGYYEHWKIFAHRLLVFQQVDVRFADSIRKPGEPTKLIITAAPGSLVAVTAVDKSVHLFAEGNELTQDDVSL